MASNALLIFLKKPVPGKVKTRLAADLGDQAAAEAYKTLYRNTISRVLDPSWKIIFYIADDVSGFEEYTYERRVQSSGDLGQKMHHAFVEACRENEAVVLIGSDCPYLGTAEVSEAFDSLKTNDVVFGPSTDGGYYLIGLKNPAVPLFTDISWSTSKVLDQSLAAATQVGLKVHLLREWSDVDTIADWKAWLDYLGKNDKA